MPNSGRQRRAIQQETSAISRCAAVLDRMFSRAGAVGRLGCTDFAVILYNFEDKDAYVLCERVRASVMNEPIPVKGVRKNMTISVGIASAPDETLSGCDDLEGRAELAVNQAISLGGNRVCFYSKGLAR